MKRFKWFIFASFILSVSMAAQENKIRLKLFASYDFNNQYSVEDNDEEKIKHNSSVGVEILPFNNLYLLTGFGVEYQFPRKIKNTETEFKFIPVYFLFNAMIGKYKYQPIISARVGYSIFNMEYGSPTDITFSGGFYYALGGGVIIDNFITEILYSSCRGVINPPKPVLESDFYFNLVSIKLGFIM